MCKLIPPVLIIGAHRSGTTMLYRFLSSLPGMCGWYEPMPIWRTGHAYRDSDVAVAVDAKPWVKTRIRRLFEKYQERNGGSRIVEKTPCNVLRVKFIHEVLPEAKILHIVRDGRANLCSLLEKYESDRLYTLRRRKLGRRSVVQYLTVRLSQALWWEWPAYLPRACHGFWKTHFSKEHVAIWGLRYPGWRRDIAKGLPIHEVAAKQWVSAVDTALANLETLPATSWLNLRYEDVVRDPQLWLQRIADFCEIGVAPDTVAELSESVHDQSLDRWRTRIREIHLSEVMLILKPTLRKLGYLQQSHLNT